MTTGLHSLRHVGRRSRAPTGTPHAPSRRTLLISAPSMHGVEQMPAAVYTGDGRSRCRRCRCRSPAPAKRSSRSRTAASAAPTCTSCSRSTRARVGARARVGGHGRRASAPDVGRRSSSARASSPNPTPGLRRVPRVPCAGGRRCACAGRRPTTSTSAARSRRYVIVDAARAARRSRPACRPRGRAHRADRDRDAHGQPVGRRRPATACSSPAAARSGC